MDLENVLLPPWASVTYLLEVTFGKKQQGAQVHVELNSNLFIDECGLASQRSLFEGSLRLLYKSWSGQMLN